MQGGRALYSHAPDRTDGFPVAAERVVRFLSDAVPLCAWLVALVDSGGGWTPVAAADRGYGFVLGARLSWQDTLCSRMVQGLGPHVSARVETDTSYANAPIGQSYPIRAYVGTALLDPSGDVVTWWARCAGWTPVRSRPSSSSTCRSCACSPSC